MRFGLLLDVPYSIVWVTALVLTCDLKGQASNVKVEYRPRKVVLNFVIFFYLEFFIHDRKYIQLYFSLAH